MDNVNYNFYIIEKLINCSLKEPQINLYYKPIIIEMMSIIECVLYDLIQRATDIVHEHINVSQEELDEIRTKDIPDKLKCYTDICIKHQLLGEDIHLHNEIYKFILIRNRVHIPNTKNDPPKKEKDLWNANLVKSCGALLKATLIYTCTAIPRPEQFHSSPAMNAFPTPWEELK